MGGTVKLITNEPNLTAFSGSLDATVSGTQGGGANGGGDLMLNMPIIVDKLALRVVGTEKYTSGWIDRVVGGPDFPLETNPTCGAFYGCTRGDVTDASVTKVYKDVNSTQLSGARASLLAQPTSALSVEGSLMYQRTTAGGYSEYDDLNGASGRLAHYQPFDLKEPFSDTFKLASGVIKYDIGSVQITSATSYWHRVESQTMDATELVQNLLDMNFYSPITFTERDESHQFSQELRAASKGSGPFQWVGGVFYSSMTSTWHDTNQAAAYAPLSVGGAAANPDGVVYDSNNPYRMDQYAAFGEASYKLPLSLKATVGLRYYRFDTDVNMYQIGIGTATGNAEPTTAHVVTSASGFNPRFNLSYIPNGDLTVYATVAKGFRPGGVSLPAPPATCGDQPMTYGPDSVWSYEAGEKARLFDGRLSVNGDVYLMQWKGVQQSITPPCGFPYTTNAGEARAYGPELEVVGRLTESLTASFNGTYTSAKLTSVAAGTGLTVGQPILNIPDYTFSGSLTYRRRLGDDLDLTARISDNYIGSSYDVAYTVRKLPAYDLLDTRLTLARGPRSVTLFVSNVTNTRAQLTVNNTAFAWLTPSDKF
jgi:outer membrane receptor protein involved in Fe transport